MNEVWRVVLGRDPKRQESAAALELIRTARTPDEKGDALTDVFWALCHTEEFEALQRRDEDLLRAIYRLTLRREPTGEEESAALEILAEAKEPAARGAALEGLFTGLIRTPESVLRHRPAAL